jgi:hypothetical protein
MKLRGGEFSTGTTGNFQPELTTSPCGARDRGSRGILDATQRSTQAQRVKRSVVLGFVKEMRKTEARRKLRSIIEATGANSPSYVIPSSDLFAKARNVEGRKLSLSDWRILTSVATFTKAHSHHAMPHPWKMVR